MHRRTSESARCRAAHHGDEPVPGAVASGRRRGTPCPRPDAPWGPTGGRRRPAASPGPLGERRRRRRSRRWGGWLSSRLDPGLSAGRGAVRGGASGPRAPGPRAARPPAARRKARRRAGRGAGDLLVEVEHPRQGLLEGVLRAISAVAARPSRRCALGVVQEHAGRGPPAPPRRRSRRAGRSPRAGSAPAPAACPRRATVAAARQGVEQRPGQDERDRQVDVQVAQRQQPRQLAGRDRPVKTNFERS